MKRKLISKLAIIALSASLINVAPELTVKANTIYEPIATEDILNINDVETTITLGESISINGTGATVNNNVITITAGGTYSISGELSDGQIIVNSEDEKEVQILLNGVNITSSTTSPIYVESSEKTVITLADNTINTISDATNYIYEDDESDEPDAAIFSKDDLIINGTGSLLVNGNYNTGIRSKDDLTIESGNITVNSVDDGIKGKDSLTILNGNFTINAGADGLKATNSSKETKGYVRIDGGTFNITCNNDGIQAESKIIINDGTFNILSGNGSEYGEEHTEENPMMPPDGNLPTDGEVPPELPDNNGTLPPNFPNDNNGELPPELPSGSENMTPPTIEIPSTNDTSTDTSTDSDTSSESKKGIKAVIGIEINDGIFNLNCADDTINSDGFVTINNGDFTIETGDDALHSETDLNINNGFINITKSYEGLEGNLITIKDGTIKIVSSDDGINGSEITETDSTDEDISTLSVDTNSEFTNPEGNMPGIDTSNSNAIINIDGGYILVNASGDGLDSNGSIYINGGTTIINGAESNDNGALDYDVDCIVTSGTLIAVGSSGMAQYPSATSTQSSIVLKLSNQAANTLVNIQSEDGENILTFSPSNKYSSIVISSPKIKTGTTYTAYIGGASTGTSIDGLYDNGTYSGGTKVGSVTISNSISTITQEGINPGGHPTFPGNNEKPSIDDTTSDDTTNNTNTNDTNTDTIKNDDSSKNNTSTSSSNKTNTVKTGDNLDILLYVGSLLTIIIAFIISIARKLINNK